MRIPIIAGNWKMNTSADEALDLVKEMSGELMKIKGVEKVVCPPFISLVKVRELLRNSDIKIGAQNMFYEEKGAFTGEISPAMLKDVCEFVILGHSERRQCFFETDEMINKKIKAAFKSGLKPIFCVGERLEENEAGKTQEVITGQVKNGLGGISEINNLVVAYEPVWAIGTGKAATGEQANGTIGFIRSIVRELYGSSSAGDLRIQYGGSVTAQNIEEFISQPEIDGALVGGASLKAAQFVDIIRKTAAVKSHK